MLTVGATLAAAGDTLGYDFLAYHAAAARVIGGQPSYDVSFEAAGGFGLFYYPPTFIPLVVPFGLLAASTATWAWTALLILCFAIGTAAMPVAARTKWLIVLLAALSWPFLYALKLGQVGPILFALMAIGWRGLDRPGTLGTTGALGAAIKIQPGLILLWALLTRRWLASLVGVVVLVALALAATILAGVSSWRDFTDLVGRVADPITTAHNFTPGAIAYQAGAPRDAAVAIQWISTIAVVLAFVASALWLPSVSSYLVAVVASQLISPILWDHYAIVLLLPAAWLIDRGHRWGALIPLATPVLLVGLTPPVVYPVVFGLTLALVAAVGFRERIRPAPAPDGVPAHA